jgi:hypothetical protein
VPASSSGLALRVSPIPGAFDRPHLVGPDPVGEQRQLHMMHHAVAMEAVAARVGHNARHGPGLLLDGPAEPVPGGEPSPASCEIVTEKRLSAVESRAPRASVPIAS